MTKFRIQPHVRLQEWVAEDLGFFRDEGLDYEFEAVGFAGASSTTSPSVTPGDAAPAAARSGAFEDMEQGRTCDVSSACHWAVNAAASSRHGRMWGKAYSICDSAIFVAADSPYRRPEDLAGAKVGVGYHSGSHYSAIQALEPFLERSEIALQFVGLPFDRVRLMQRGEIDVANVFGASTTCSSRAASASSSTRRSSWASFFAEDADAAQVDGYFRALRHAQREIDLEPERFKHYWLREIPEDLAAGVDVRRFGPGERIVFEPYTRDMFERTHRWMEGWGLFDARGAARPEYDTAVLV